jgi:hypothetical protein
MYIAKLNYTPLESISANIRQALNVMKNAYYEIGHSQKLTSDAPVRALVPVLAFLPRGGLSLRRSNFGIDTAE